MSEQLITGLGAVRLFVSDLERAVNFYRNTLGLDLTAQDGPHYAVFQLPHVTEISPKRLRNRRLRRFEE